MKRITGCAALHQMIKNHRKQIVVAVIAAAVVIAGCVFGGIRVYQHFHGGSVNIYSVEELGMDPQWIEEDSTIQASVSTDQLQTVYLSDSQEVDEIYVSKGQKVKEGEKLFSYDSTLDQISLKRKDISIQKKKITLSKEKKELAVIQTYRAGVPIPGSTANRSSEGSSGTSGSSSGQSAGSTESSVPSYEGLELLGGNGTARSPYYYAWSSEFTFTKKFIAAAMQGKDEAYVIFLLSGSEIPEYVDDGEGDLTGDEENDSSQEKEENTGEEESVSVTVTSLETEGKMLSGESDDAEQTQDILPDDTQYFASWTMQFQKSGSGYRYVMLSMNVGGAERVISDPLEALASDDDNKDDDNKPDDSEPDDDDANDDGDDKKTVYTQTELNQMIADQKQVIRDLELEIRQAQLEYKKLEKECEDSIVYAEVDGVVTVLRSPQNAGTEKPFLKLSGSNAGYSIESCVSELDLDTISVGQVVTVTNQDSGETYEGKVDSISRYPTDDEDAYWLYGGGGSPNSSYYPYTISIDSYADFDLDSYVTVSYQEQETGETSSSYYLPKAFVRTENGSSYLYVGESNGTLEKRTVNTGKQYWGSYIEITEGGIAPEEKVAFPYGKNVHDGAQTREATLDELYSYGMG